MSQGKIVEYIEQGKMICSLCLQDKGTRLHLLTMLNRQVNLPPKRVIFISSSHISTDSPREEILNRLREIDLNRIKLKEEVKIEELWELIKDEDQSYDYKYLAHLCFGETVTEDHISALVRALFDDKFYFKMKDGRFIPNSEEKVELIIKQQQAEEVKEEKLDSGSAWLKKVLKEGVSGPGEHNQEVIDILIDLAIHGKDADEFKFKKELVSRAGIAEIGEARKILVNLGVWEKDEPVDLIRFGIRRHYSEDQLKECRRLEMKDINPAGYEDLCHLNTFTIDGPDTLDFDDALSVDFQDNIIQVGIHIADVSSVIDAETELDREALMRGSSLYLPRRQIPMFPPELSHDRLSLKKGVKREALSLLVNFDREGDIFDYRFVPSVIEVKEQLSYDQVNALYENEDDTVYHHLYRLAEKRKRYRVEQGALILSLPDLHIDVDGPSVDIKLASQETPSRIMVAEMMILYNWLAARFCRDNHVPTIYRGQKEPGEKLSLDDTGYVYYVFRQRRKLHPLIIDVEPHPHAGLGLDSYINVSSPIRRYFDLISQRQMLWFISKGTCFYNKEELDKIRLQVTASLKDHNIIRRNRNNYWIIRYLGNKTGTTLPAIVLDALKSMYRIILTDFNISVEMKREKDNKLKSGEEIMVRVVKSDPWNGILKLEHAKE
ncbi:ribonuclease catalytic domain-containing protein [Thermodesulfobacteriota bacterium]